MLEAILPRQTIPGKRRAISVLAGLAPLCVSYLVGIVLTPISIWVASDQASISNFIRAHNAADFLASIVVALAVGWVLKQAGSVRWGVGALFVVGLLQGLGYSMQVAAHFVYQPDLVGGAEMVGPAVQARIVGGVLETGIWMLILAALVLAGSWLRYIWEQRT